MAGHKSLKRLISRAAEELRATWRIARATSFSGAAVTFVSKLDIQKMNRNGFQEPPAVKKRLLRKHEVMLEYFGKEFSSFAQTYDFDRPLPDDRPELRDRVWVCWWQGLENAPELVRECIASVQRYAGGRQVTVITEDNYKEYASIPAWVEEMHKAGTISRTHYSDILRLSLLAQHGGLWLDATFYCAGPSLEPYFNAPLWTIKRPDYLHCSVAAGQFATYSLACSYENRWIFATFRDYLLHYWQTNDMLIDYLVLDYLMALAIRHDPKLTAAFAAVKPNNPNCDELCKILSEPFDEALWVRLKTDTPLFKLTWKQDFPMEKDGTETFFARLISKTL